MSFTIEILTLIWLASVSAYGLIFLYRSTVSLHEDDSIHLNAGEAKFETEQRHTLERMTTLDSRAKAFGILALCVTSVLAVLLAYDAALRLGV